MLKTKIKQIISWQRIFAFFALIALVAVSVSGPLGAQNVTQGYNSDIPMQKGMIVQLKKSDTTKVELVSIETLDQMHGVVVEANDAPLTLSDEGRKVFVAINSPFEVLVSDQNGPIEPGDYITISALQGVGMKAGVTEPIVVGRALTGFDGKSGVVSSSEITDSAGAKKQVNLSRVNVDISVSRNPNLKGEDPNVPEVLRRASESIAGKKVNATRIYLSVFVFIISTIAATSLLYAGVRNGLISIGRNPLSRKMIVKGMFQVILTGLIIFITGLFGVYLLLKL